MSALTMAPALHRAGAPAPTGRVLSYERISRFRVVKGNQAANVSRGVDRQWDDAQACAGYLGLGPISDDARYTDNNRSASRYATRERERFEDLLLAIGAGGVAYVLVWLLDRVIRTTEDLDRLLRACEANGTLLVQTASGSIVDPTNPESVLHAKISGAVAEYEAAKMSMRIRRQQESAAAAGRPHGGRRRFGFETDGRVVESEASAVRAVVARLLHGESLNACAKWLNAEGYRGTSGAEFTGPNLRQLVQRPYLAGLRVHRGAVVGAGDWDQIITVADHEAVVHLLSDPARRTSYTNARRYLLAGLAVCDACGADLRGRPGTKANPERRAYACATGRHCYRATEDVDAVVTERAIRRLERLSEAGALDLDDDPTADEVGAIDAALEALAGRTEDLAGLLATGDVDAAAYAAATKRLATERDSLTARRADLLAEARRPDAVLDGMTGPGAREAWERADLGRRRAVIDVLYAEVRLAGAATRRAPFRAADVTLVPRIG